MMTKTMSFDLRLIPTILLGGTLFLASCSDEPAGEPYVGVGAQIEGSEDALAEHVEKILERSQEGTEGTVYTLQDMFGREIELPARIVKRAQPAPTMPDFKPVDILGDVPPPLGEVNVRLDRVPNAFALGNDGELVYPEANRTVLRKQDGTSIALADRPATHLQFDETGERLLLQIEDRILVVSGADWSEKKDVSDHPPGIAWWTGDKDRLLFTRSIVDFDASSRNRVSIEIAYMNLAHSRTEEAGWSPFASFASIGTLPSVAYTWGVLNRRYQLDPVPGPLYILEEGTPVDPLTKTDSAADIHPTADRQGNLFWIRTPRHRSAGGRAMYRRLDMGLDDALTITGFPTWRVAASPRGPWVAVVFEENPDVVAVRSFRKELLESESKRFEAYAASVKKLETLAEAVESGMVANLAGTPQGAAVKEEQFGPVLDVVPTAALTQQMANALRLSLKRHFGVEESEPLSMLAQTDRVFHYASPWMSEHPAMILGLAGLFVEALPEAGWSLGGASKDLSAAVRDISTSAEPAGNFVLPFGAARERIGGNLSLSDAASELRQSEFAPLYLVENFSEETIALAENAAWEKAGLPNAISSLDELKSVVDDDSSADLVLLRLLKLARQESDTELALRVALRLADRYPTNAVTLRYLGDALMEAFHTREALAVFNAAVELDPTRAYIRLRAADAMLALDELDDAKEQYLLLVKIPSGEAYADQVAARLELIGTMKD